MGYWETSGQSSEWYTPSYIFDALGATFDLDVANGAPGGGNVPCKNLISVGSLEVRWPPQAHVWMNPPFGGRNGIVPWLNKFFAHGDGIALTPDRTSATWWQNAARHADATLLIHGKVKFERPDGSVGKAPSNGTTLFAAGGRGVAALRRAAPILGILMEERT